MPSRRLPSPVNRRERADRGTRLGGDVPGASARPWERPSLNPAFVTWRATGAARAVPDPASGRGAERRAAGVGAGRVRRDGRRFGGDRGGGAAGAAACRWACRADGAGRLAGVGTGRTARCGLRPDVLVRSAAADLAAVLRFGCTAGCGPAGVCSCCCCRRPSRSVPRSTARRSGCGRCSALVGHGRQRSRSRSRNPWTRPRSRSCSPGFKPADRYCGVAGVRRAG